MLSFVFSFSAFAATEEPEALAENDFIISTNVAYNDNIHLLIALDKAKVEDPELVSVNILNSEGKVLLNGLKVEFEVDDLYDDDDVITPAYVVRTLGVSAKDMSNLYTINVYYDGELCQTTEYSVLRYFLDRLYADGIINATKGEDLKRKTLYLSTLRWGQAAEVVLEKQNSHIADYTYAAIEGGDATISYGDTLSVALPDGYWIVSQYDVAGQIVNKSIESAGNVALSGFCYVEKLNLSSYSTPEGAETFDNVIIPEMPSTGDTEAKGVAQGSTSLNLGFYKQQYSVTAFSIIDKNGDNKLRVAKTGYTLAEGETRAANAQSWPVFEKPSNLNGATILFETKLSVAAGSSTGYFRIYKNKTASNPANGSLITGCPTFAFARKNGYWNLYTGGSNTPANSSYNVITSIPVTEEIVFGLIIKSDDTVTAYYVNEDGHYVTLSQFTLAGVYASQSIIYTCDSGSIVTTDFDDVYFGPLKEEILAIPVLK